MMLLIISWVDYNSQHHFGWAI